MAAKLVVTALVVVVSSSTIAATLSWNSSAECKEILKQQDQAWREAYFKKFSCWAESRCGNPGLDPQFKHWSAQINELREQCSEASRAEANSRNQEKSAHEQQAKMSEQQKTQDTERRQQEALIARSTARNAQKTIIPLPESSGGAVAGKALDMLTGLLANRYSGGDSNDTPATNSTYSKAEPAQQLIGRAMGPAAAAAQEISLGELRGYHSQLERDLRGATEAISGFSAEPNQVAPRTVGGPNPWATPGSQRLAVGDRAAEADAASTSAAPRNPWASSTGDPTGIAASELQRVEAPQAAIGIQGARTTAENPWAEHPESEIHVASACKAPSSFHFKWAGPKRDETCYSNVGIRREPITCCPR